MIWWMFLNVFSGPWILLHSCAPFFIKNVKNYILWLCWRNNQYDPRYIHYCYIHFIFLILKEIKMKLFSWSLKILCVLGTVSSIEVISVYTLCHHPPSRYRIFLLPQKVFLCFLPVGPHAQRQPLFWFLLPYSWALYKYNHSLWLYYTLL